MSRPIITRLNHDLVHHKRYAKCVSSNDPEKHLNLEVPFGTSLDDAEAQGKAALGALTADLEDTSPEPALVA
jgi:hypothetical protein